MLKIAIIGLFNLKNSMDTLLNEILSKKLNGVKECEISLFSYTEDKDENIFSVNDLEKMHVDKKFDAFLLLGNDMIGVSQSDLWLIPSLIGTKYGVNVIWNAPSVIDEFTGYIKETAKKAFESVDYLSVRDEASKCRLANIGINEDKIVLADDILFTVNDLYDVSVIKECSSKLTETDNYIVVNITPYLNDEIYQKVNDKISEYKENGFEIVMLPVMNSRGEYEFVKEYSKNINCDVTVIEKENDIKEVLGLVAGAKKVVTYNYSLAACAYSYGVQAVDFDFETKLINGKSDSSDNHINKMIEIAGNEKQPAELSLIDDVVNCFRAAAECQMIEHMKNEINALRAVNELYKAKSDDFEQELHKTQDLMKLFKAKSEDFEKELHSTQGNLKYYKNSFDTIMETHEKELADKNAVISNLSRQMYEMENSRAFKFAKMFSKR